MTLGERDPQAEQLAALLDWYRHAGVDWALDERPHDRFADFAAPEDAREPPLPLAEQKQAVPVPRSALPPRNAAPRPAPGEPSALLAADAATVAAAAREIAGAAGTLAALRGALGAFEGCPLKATSTNLVFEDGNPQAPVMLIGEAPEGDEDSEGRPFAGRAGALLDKMLAAIGLDRTRVYLAGVVPWRPPGNRPPTPVEMAACLPFLLRQIELAAPKYLVTMGVQPTQALTQSREPLMRLRGRWGEAEIAGRRVPLLPMQHPKFLLRTPSHKKQAWEDLRSLRRVLDGNQRPA